MTICSTLSDPAKARSIYDTPAPVLTQNEKLAIHAEATAVITAAHGERPDHSKIPWGHPFGDKFEARVKAAWWDNQVALLCRHMCAVATVQKRDAALDTGALSERRAA